MKIPAMLALALLGTAIALAQPAPTPQPAPMPPPAPLPPRPMAPPLGQPPAAPRDTANYLITVKWTDAKAGTNSLQVLTAEGAFTLETIQASVRINDSDIPTTVSFNGTITPLSPEKGRLKVFLGRTIPYVTSTYNAGSNKSSSYQQLRVGLDSTFTVTFGKPLVVQADQNGEVAILVKREEN
jgi:hypothetical protein